MYFYPSQSLELFIQKSLLFKIDFTLDHIANIIKTEGIIAKNKKVKLAITTNSTMSIVIIPAKTLNILFAVAMFPIETFLHHSKIICNNPFMILVLLIWITIAYLFEAEFELFCIFSRSF